MREVSQRELRNDSGQIMREVDEGASFVITRNGSPVAELVPLRRHRFVEASFVVAAFHGAPRVEFARFRQDLNRVVDQASIPRG